MQKKIETVFRASLMFSVAVILSSCYGCFTLVKDLGLGALTVYEVQEVTFSEAQLNTLRAWRKADKETYDKFEGQLKYYRRIVLDHNKKALEINRQRLETMGFDVNSSETGLQVSSPKK